MPIRGSKSAVEENSMKLLASGILAVVLVSSCSAQAPKVEIFGGYSVEHIAPCGTSTTFGQEFSCGLELGELAASKGYFNGWEASVTGFAHRYYGFTADFAGHYDAFGSDSRYSFLFGPTFALHTPIISPFAHALFGAVKESGAFDPTRSFTKAELVIGGGVDVNLARHVAARVAQIDYEWQKNPTDGLPNPNGLRFSAGVVFKL
jgi:hypothetical protein